MVNNTSIKFRFFITLAIKCLDHDYTLEILMMTFYPTFGFHSSLTNNKTGLGKKIDS